MGTFRLAAFDLDGTLFNSNAQISAETVAVLRRVAARGIHLVAATGRSHSTAASRLAPTQAIEWALCSNGATVYHVPTDAVTLQRLIPDEEIAPLIEAVRAADPTCSFGWESTTEHIWTEAFNAVAERHLVRRAIVPNDAPPPTNVVKLFIGHPTTGSSALLGSIRPVVSSGVSVTSSGARFLEVTGPGVNKASALASLCEQLGVSQDEVVAFGDNLNDLEMLTWAGRGYAMANALHEVVAAAGHRTRLPNTEDGVADVLTELFLG